MSREMAPMDRAHNMEARALWLGAPRTPEFRPEVVPPPGPGQVRVRAVASAISHGTEMLVYRGQVPPGIPLDLSTCEGSFRFPIKYGYAMVGRVIDTGEEVDNLAPGDRVFALHPHQTVFNAPANMLVRLPPDLDPLLGVFFANLETALNVMLDTPVKLGENALVFGHGTVGALVSLLLKRAGANVIVVDPIPSRRELAMRLGAEAALEPGDCLPERIKEASPGGTRWRGADVAIEASGSQDALQQAVDTVADEGTVVVVSWYGTKSVTLQLGGHFHRGRVRVRSSQVGHLDPALAGTGSGVPKWRSRSCQPCPLPISSPTRYPSKTRGKRTGW